MRIIAGEWRGRRIEAPRGRKVRPTTDRVREAWMSALGGRFEGLTVLDLFAGSGALGLECLSRGAEAATFVDVGHQAIVAIKKNVRTLGAEARSQVVKSDAIRFASRLGPIAYDIAVADPPYGDGYAEQIAGLFAESAFARELWIEHDKSEAGQVAEAVDVPVRQRRYGNTVITSIEAVP